MRNTKSNVDKCFETNNRVIWGKWDKSTSGVCIKRRKLFVSAKRSEEWSLNVFKTERDGGNVISANGIDVFESDGKISPA